MVRKNITNIILTDVLNELELRHKVNFQKDKDLWVDWFCEEFNTNTELIKSIQMTLRIKKAERKFKESKN